MSLRRGELTHARALLLVQYDPDTGVMVHRRDSRNAHAGAVVGHVNSEGYLRTQLDGCDLALHRLAVFYMTGHWPSAEVDHLDGNRQNNRWKNLRECSRKVNLQNRRKPNKNNVSGLLGAHFHPLSGKYQARVSVDGKAHHLGLFKTPQEAHDAYVAAKRHLHEGNTL